MLNKYDHGIFKVETANEEAVKLIGQTHCNFTTFNQLVENFEARLYNGVLFICNNDTECVVFQHLILFARYYKLPVFGLKKGSRSVIEASLKRKNVTLVFVKSEDPLFNALKDLLMV